MPLPKRSIVPVIVSNVVVPDEVDNELEYVANATLSNLTRQLASLSLQAADIFSELTDHLIEMTNRNVVLNQRIDILKLTLSEIAIKEDNLLIGLMSLQSNPYKSRMEADQQVLNKKSMPNAISEMYHLCEPPPALEQLDKFRYDNKQSMKFYTDPTFFFHLWCQEMLQDTKQKKKKKRRREKKQPLLVKRLDSQCGKTNSELNKMVNNESSPNNNSQVSRVSNGFEPLPPPFPTMECQSINLPQPQFNYEDVSIYSSIVPQTDVTSPMSNTVFRTNQEPDNDPCGDLHSISLPPPSMTYLSHKPGAHPTITSSNAITNTNHSSLYSDVSFTGPPSEIQDPIETITISPVPPPPAPPPPPSIPPPPLTSTIVLQPVKSANENKQPIYASNTQSIDLLSAIRSGIQLRKVGDGDNRPVPITEFVSKAEKKCDVQAIFEEVYKRRPYVDNNSDSDDGSEDDEDSSMWSSDNDK